MRFLVVVLAIVACTHAAPDRRPPATYGAPPPVPRPFQPVQSDFVAAPQQQSFNFAQQQTFSSGQQQTLSSGQQQTLSSAQPKKVIAILSQDFQLDSNGYSYHYQTEDNQNKQEVGKVIPGTPQLGPDGYETDDNGSLQVQGSYNYQAPDGTPISLTYTADENGFQPKGDHLPTPPPIPAELAEAIAKHEAATAAVAQTAGVPAASANFQQFASISTGATYQRPQYSRYQ